MLWAGCLKLALFLYLIEHIYVRNDFISSGHLPVISGGKHWAFPFEPLYGWPVRGPLSIVKDSWVDGNNDEEPVVVYVFPMRSNPFQCVEEAHNQFEDSPT